MAKKKIAVTEQADESTAVITETNTEANSAEDVKPKRTRKPKTVEVPAESVAAVDDNLEATPLTDIIPEIAGETVIAEVPEETTNAEALPEITEENIDEIKEAPAKKPAKRSVKKADAPKDTKPVAYEINELAWLYPTSIARFSRKTITGTVYLCGDMVTDRYPVTTKAEDAMKPEKFCGWVDAKYIK